ncbi:MAG: succinate--CoA ligase subunit alpha [Granulosicoccaceae bacterium]
MSILIDADTKVVMQGLGSRTGEFHCQEMLDYGTKIVAGVSPGKGGQSVLGIPLFNTVKDAVAATGATASMITVPPPTAADAIMEAVDSGITVAVSVTDGIPAQDMIKVKRYMRMYRSERRMRLIGPNCSGIVNPGKILLGIMPSAIYTDGNIGIVSRSGTLGYEAALQIAEQGLGVSSSIGIGGDPIVGSTFHDILQLFEADDDTHAVVLIGEIGGPQEADAARYISESMNKPVVAYVAGRGTRRNQTMGHAGAIISAFGDSADEKQQILRNSGAHIAPLPSEIGATVVAALGAGS